jgi:hypothetical protein
VTTADAVFVIVVIVRHVVSLLMGRPSIGPDKKETEGASHLFPRGQNKSLVRIFGAREPPLSPKAHSDQAS